MFQSTFPRGERQLSMQMFLNGNLSFNPRSHEGNDGTKGVSIPNYFMFQSTFPRGERPIYTICSTGIQCFNPRSHEGNDPAPGDCLRIKPRFQSTFPRGERPFLHPVLPVLSPVSIHVPTRGTTSKRYDTMDSFDVSIHVPTRGTTAV